MATESEILARSIGEINLSPASSIRLHDLVAQIDLSVWFETVDDSPYALSDWLRALIAFDEWLEDKKIIARPINFMLGYLECCTLSVAETLSLPDFADLTRENLDRYGFDATRPASTDSEDENNA